ncbi:MAG: F0F1 ATP synthase subunit A [Nitrospinae bacterium]|nr:F0F1 ATP synthase subunit A [Nitrospinota bacterium]
MAAGMHEVLLMDAIVDPNKIPHNVTYAILASVILITTALVIRRSLRMVPTGVQNVMESVVETFLKLTEENIGHHWGRTLFPLVGTLFMFILICNLMGLIPGFACPTGNINTTASMAVPVFLIYQFYGVKVHGIKYINHFLGPIRSFYALPLMIMMFFIEFIGHLVRPVTLSVRLFGNMMGKHILLGVLAMLVPWIIPTLVLALGTLIGFIQAFVFALLTTLYLAGAIEEGH